MQTRYCSAPRGPETSAEFLSPAAFPLRPKYHQEKLAGVGGAVDCRPPVTLGRLGADAPDSASSDVLRCRFTSCTTQWPTPFRVCKADNEMLSPRFKLSWTAALPRCSAQTWCLSSGSILACSLAAAMALSNAGIKSDAGASLLAVSSCNLAECVLPGSAAPAESEVEDTGSNTSATSSTMNVSRFWQPSSVRRWSSEVCCSNFGGTPTLSSCRSASMPVFSATRALRSDSVAWSGIAASVVVLDPCLKRNVKGIVP